MSFGTTLKRLRKEKGISQRDLAEKVFLNHTYISKIESGSLEPPSEHAIVLMAMVLNTDKHDLIFAANKIPTDIEQVILNNEDLRARLKEYVKQIKVKSERMINDPTEIRKQLHNRYEGGKIE